MKENVLEKKEESVNKAVIKKDVTKGMVKEMAKEMVAEKKVAKTVKETVKAEAPKAEAPKKEAPKKEEVKKEAPKAKVEKAAAPKAAKVGKKEVFIQVGEREIRAEDIQKKVEAAYNAEGNKLKVEDDVRVYLKPEENMIYYVVNNSYASGISLFD